MLSCLISIKLCSVSVVASIFLGWECGGWLEFIGGLVDSDDAACSLSIAHVQKRDGSAENTVLTGQVLENEGWGDSDFARIVTDQVSDYSS